MPAPRKPMNVHRLSGAVEKNPARFKNRAEPAQDQRSIGRAPAGLTADQKQAWKEVVSNDSGVLTRADRAAVELAARLLAEIRSTDKPLASKQSLLASLLGKLGQTPHGRNYVTVNAADERSKNPFAKFARKK